MVDFIDFDFSFGLLEYNRNFYFKIRRLFNYEKSVNYAFIDIQNVYSELKRQNWKLDMLKFREYLEIKYDIKNAYIFIGYIEGNNDMYKFLRKCGYILVFKEILNIHGMIKGNVDADLVLRSLVYLDNYDKSVLVSGDGDFSSLVNYLFKKNKLLAVLVPDNRTCSYLLRKSAKNKLVSLSEIRNILEYKKRDPTS